MWENSSTIKAGKSSLCGFNMDHRATRKGRLKEAVYDLSLGRKLKKFSKLTLVHLTAFFALENLYHV